MEHTLDLLHSQIMLLQNMLRQQTVPHSNSHSNSLQHCNQKKTHAITPLQLDAVAFRHEREDSIIIAVNIGQRYQLNLYHY
jgi:hypothetical protein